MPKWGDSTKNIREIRGIRGLGLYFSGFGTLLFGVWDFTFCGFEVGFVVWNYFLGRNGGEIGKKCVTLQFDELKPPEKNTLNN